MTALVRGRSQRSSSTGVAVRSSHARSTTRNHFSSRTATLPRCGNGATLALGSRGHSAGGHDHDVLERRDRNTSELQSHHDLVCRLLLEKKKKQIVSSQ